MLSASQVNVSEIAEVLLQVTMGILTIIVQSLIIPDP